MAEVMRAVEVHRLQQRILGGWPEDPLLRVRIDGSDVGRHEFGEGAVDCGH
jgi:hypothetical protein